MGPSCRAGVLRRHNLSWRSRAASARPAVSAGSGGSSRSRGPLAGSRGWPRRSRRQGRPAPSVDAVIELEIARARRGCRRSRAASSRPSRWRRQALRAPRSRGAPSGAFDSAIRRRRRPDPGAEQRFVGVDIANANDEMIVHQRKLDRRRAAPRRAPQIVGVAGRVERLGTEPREQRMGLGGRRAPRASRRSGADRDSAASRRNRERCRHGRADAAAEGARMPAGCRSSRNGRAACRVPSRNSRYLLRRSSASIVRPAMRAGSHRGTDQRNRRSYRCMSCDAPADDERRDAAERGFDFGQFRHGSRAQEMDGGRPPDAAPPVWWAAEYTLR